MARLLLAALALCCSSTIHLAEAGRSLLISDEQAQAAVKSLDQAAGNVLSQLSTAVASTDSSNSSSNNLQDKTLNAINAHAPFFKTDLGYFIRPQVLLPTSESLSCSQPRARTQFPCK